MKNLISTFLSLFMIASIVFISCKPKNDSTAITPTYKEEGTSTGGNPNLTNVTTTGTIATTSTANQNSSIPQIGQSGAWTTPGCGTLPIVATCFSANNSSTGTNVSVCFSITPVAGTYQLVNNSSALSSGPNKAFLKVTNPAGQPTGSVWLSSGGTAVVTFGGGGNVIITFSNVACLQSNSFFPTVTVSGQVGCI